MHLTELQLNLDSLFCKIVGRIQLDSIYKASIQFLVHNKYLAKWGSPQAPHEKKSVLMEEKELFQRW